MTESPAIHRTGISEQQLARARAFGISEERLIELLERGVTLPPTEDELPYSDGKPLESERHALQADLLFETLRIAWADRKDVYVGKNQFLYFSEVQAENEDFLGPDLFVALGVAPRERKVWAVWLEGKGPDVVIELLSYSTAFRDKVVKKEIYRDKVRVPEYFWYHPFTGERAGFSLRDGAYVPIDPDAEGRLTCSQLGLLLVDWDGSFRGVPARWLRWSTMDGTLLLTGEELAARAAERAEQERERAAQAERRLAEMEAQLTRYRERFGQMPE